MSRKEIINKIIDEQRKIIENLENSVDRYKTNSDMDENDTSDPDDFARQTEAKDMQLRFEKMLTKEKKDLAFLLSEVDKTHDSAEPGALIETDKNFFFICVPIPVFRHNGKDVFSISPEAPVYSKLRGKKIGDQIEVGPNTFQIESIS